jgi:hypothetical protein
LLVALKLAAGGLMLSEEETTSDPVVADVRNFYEVELWTRDDFIERMLFAGTSLDQACAVFADYCAVDDPGVLER